MLLAAAIALLPSYVLGCQSGACLSSACWLHKGASRRSTAACLLACEVQQTFRIMGAMYGTGIGVQCADHMVALLKSL